VWPALRDWRFRRVLVGQSLSSFGDSAMYLTLGIWAKDLTGSNGAAGAVFLAIGVPFLLAPFAGHLADRVRRRVLLVATNAAVGLAVLSLLAVRSAEQLWLIYAFSAFYGLASQLGTAAGAGLIKDMLQAGDLASANAAFQTTRQGVRLASPLVGAALYTRLGGGGLAIFDAVSFVAAIAALATIHVAESPVVPAPEEPLRAQILAGFVHIRRTDVLRRITTSSTLALLTLGFYESLTFAVLDALHRPPSFFGVLMSVQAVGSILGGMVVGRLVSRFGEARVLGVALSAWVIASLAYTIASLPIAFAALLIFGIAVTLHAVAIDTSVQWHTPARLVGRTASGVSMLTKTAQTSSIALGAALIDRIDYRILLLTTVFTVAIAAVLLLRHPDTGETAGLTERPLPRSTLLDPLLPQTPVS
jgi:MFS family permease